MIFNDVQFTSTTGGTGTLSCIRQTNGSYNLPTFGDTFGGNRWVYYSINEYTDASKTILLQSENGIGQWVAGAPSTLVRSLIQSTYVASTAVYLPLNGTTTTAPTAVSFGTTSANIDILSAPTNNNTILPVPFIPSGNSGIDAIGGTFLSVSGASTTFTPATGTVYYFPVWIGFAGFITTASFRMTTATTSNGSTFPSFNMYLYEVTGNTGLPGKALQYFFSFPSPRTTAPVTITCPATSPPEQITPGWYYVGFLFIQGSDTSGCVLKACTPVTGMGVSMANNGPVCALTLAAQTGLTDPATAPTAVSTFTSIPVFTFH